MIDLLFGRERTGIFSQYLFLREEPPGIHLEECTCLPNKEVYHFFGLMTIGCSEWYGLTISSGSKVLFYEYGYILSDSRAVMINPVGWSRILRIDRL